VTGSRLAAARVLQRLEYGGTTLAAELHRARRDLDDPRDRALLLEVCSGTLRWRNALDAVIVHVTGRSIETLDPPVRAVLRVGAYQLLHLERTPAHAVVHESVDLVRALGVPRAAGFVNGSLRAIARDEGRAPLPERPAPGAGRTAQLAYLSVTLSHPQWLVARWLERYGFEATEAWCRFNNTPPAPTIRLESQDEARALIDRLSAEGVAASAARFVTTAVRLPPGALGRLPEPLRRILPVQDEGSQLVALAVGPQLGDRVLDVCAAPGGKTAILARLLGGTGLLVAGDRRLKRLALLQATLAGAGLRLPLLALDARGALPFGPVFDRVLLDAPCSGLGTLSRDPDLKWSRTEADIEAYASAQDAMLDTAACVVRPGGRLVYATCSSEPDENEEVVRRFLARTSHFSQVPVSLPSPVAHRDELIDATGCLATRPPVHGLDGFYATVLARSRSA